ncbi:uncharacterized protein [Symphalangus syndactylus]|uniref:uncharacterized protein isoform X2 n=1 Tax=Symphalangus syndactylus TaxID=9590 RepID=UPI0030047497
MYLLLLLFPPLTSEKLHFILVKSNSSMWDSRLCSALIHLSCDCIIAAEPGSLGREPLSSTTDCLQSLLQLGEFKSSSVGLKPRKC